MSSRFALIQRPSRRVTAKDPPSAKVRVFAASSITKLKLPSLLDEVSPVEALMMTTCVVEQCKYVRANTGRATITIRVATTAYLVSGQSARKRTADPPAVPRDY